ncbi:RNA polymerase sigma factor [Algoriphagus zhangzhouensis]|uniref:RNA polymerase sigma-70 factor, ECF subfamily n=1 Tax=Algoriphagus zhangzhouensis TaxID=1073327 RepID=A0A1M7ZG13_9BACT|nr:RNA polymerase sigma factor [Algoriphagus zhangzhouensis]SHO63818.1 RNA polymerase sigma-70 factor, ECF subfamily [Algoriphagus zhangzhouensis]
MKSFFEGHIWPLRNKMFRMVLLWVKDRDVAEDVLQNVFERSFERENELQGHPNLVGWLVKSLKNESMMYFRKSGRTLTLDGLEEMPVQETVSEEVTDRVSQVMQLMENLPLKQQEIFQLREVEGLSYEEIADYLEISLEQVKVNLHRARKSIRNQFINQTTS